MVFNVQVDLLQTRLFRVEAEDEESACEVIEGLLEESEDLSGRLVNQEVLNMEAWTTGEGE